MQSVHVILICMPQHGSFICIGSCWRHYITWSPNYIPKATAHVLYYRPSILFNNCPYVHHTSLAFYRMERHYSIKQLLEGALSWLPGLFKSMALMYMNVTRYVSLCAVHCLYYDCPTSHIYSILLCCPHFSPHHTYPTLYYCKISETQKFCESLQTILISQIISWL